MDEGYDRQPTEGDEALARRLTDGPAVADASELGDADARLLASIGDWARTARPRPVDEGTSARLWAKVADATSGRPETRRSVSPGLAPSAPRPYDDPRDRVTKSRPIMLRLVTNPAFRWSAAAVVALFAVWTVLRPAGDWTEIARAGATAQVVTTADGSTVTLRPNSTLLGREGESRAYRLVGEGFFEVVHDASAPFTVEAGASLVTVLGTKFDLSSWGAQPSVFLVEGRVRFEDRETRRSVELAPGQGAVLDRQGPQIREQGAEEDALDWMVGALSLSSRPLSAVVAEIEQHFGISIELPADAASERLSGRVTLADVESTLSDLATVLGGRFEPLEAGRYRFVP